MSGRLPPCLHGQWDIAQHQQSCREMDGKEELSFVISTVFILSFKVVISINCIGKEDGIYEKSCQSFSKCTNQTHQLVQCDRRTRTAFNPATGTCDNAFNVKPPCGRYLECSLLIDGGYPDLSQMCMAYYSCGQGRISGHYFCPQGLVFNQGLQVCDWPFNVSKPCGTLPAVHRPANSQQR